MLSQALNRAMPHSRSQLEAGVNRKKLYNILFSCSVVLYTEAVNLRPHMLFEIVSMIVLLSSVWTEFSNSVFLFKMYAKNTK